MPSSTEAHHEVAEPSRKRQRLVISCTECHRRKQKCDRQQPCCQCVKRGVGICCSYESPPGSTNAGSVSTERPSSVDGDESVEKWAEHATLLDLPANLPSPSTAESHATASLGYADDNSGTRSIMKLLGGGHHAPAAPQSKCTSDVASRYKALVRQLPPQNSLHKLVRFFFAEIAWQYNVIDEDAFWEQVSSWERVKYAARSQPMELDPTVRFFPALLFQVLAQAVLLQPRGNDSFLEDLRPAPDMDLLDLATEFSDAGHQLLSLFGSEPALVRVQAGLQRAIFLKMTGSVVEAWHGVGSAIRDAQELGLHRLHSSPEQDVQGCPQQARHVVASKRVWFLLHLWDAHMGVVLGRPMVTKLDPGTVPSPRGSCGIDQDGTGLAQQVTPFDLMLCGYHAAYKHLQDIHKLELWDPGALATVDRINEIILVSIDQLPMWARSTSPVHDNQVSWLPAAREFLITEIHFTLLALHRPFMFVQARNRLEALKAALQVLQSQSRVFRARDPRKFLPFTLVFATFDATVIVAAMYILFPGEHPEYLQDSLQCVQWALEMLRTMKTQNSMAASASNAVQEIYEKFLASISVSPQATIPKTSPHAMGQTAPDQMNFTDVRQPFYEHETPIQDSAGVHLMIGRDMAAVNAEKSRAVAHVDSIPHFENVLPPLPLHDLIARDPTTELPWMYGPDFAAVDNGEAHDFWQLLDTFGK